MQGEETARRQFEPDTSRGDHYRRADFNLDMLTWRVWVANPLLLESAYSLMNSL
jgi:hypothetical protein